MTSAVACVRCFRRGVAGRRAAWPPKNAGQTHLQWHVVFRHRHQLAVLPVEHLGRRVLGGATHIAAAWRRRRLQRRAIPYGSAAPQAASAPEAAGAARALLYVVPSARAAGKNKRRGAARRRPARDEMKLTDSGRPDASAGGPEQRRRPGCRVRAPPDSTAGAGAAGRGDGAVITGARRGAGPARHAARPAGRRAQPCAACCILAQRLARSRQRSAAKCRTGPPAKKPSLSAAPPLPRPSPWPA